MATARRPDTPDHAHLEWLIRSRAANQRATLLLHELIESHFEKIKKDKKSSVKAQVIAAVCFSLWRAAFLADKTGTHEAWLRDVQAFLGKLLTDNAINYPQDRASRDWTFNYYANCARDGLLMLSKAWPGVGETLSAVKKVTKGTTAPGRRWDRHQAAVEVALAEFQTELEK
jgi:hypothetical protein